MTKFSEQDLNVKIDLLQKGVWNIEESNNNNCLQISKIKSELKELKASICLCSSKLDKLLLEFEALRRNGGKNE